nr:MULTISPECIES: TetR/AcrR family transcriptional regulator [Pseudofrankia]
MDAGLELFLRQGYAATRLDEIAEQAGVAVQTVYFHFGNKRTVLKEGVDILAAGDDEPVAVLDRPWMDQVRDEPDPHQALALWMAHCRALFTRVGPLMRIVRDAAGADPDMAEQWEVNKRQRLTAYRVIAELLAAKQGLRGGLSVDEAADILFALVSFEVYLALTADRGWTPERWEHWTIGTLTADLLRWDTRPADTAALIDTTNLASAPGPSTCRPAVVGRQRLPMRQQLVGRHGDRLEGGDVALDHDPATRG